MSELTRRMRQSAIARWYFGRDQMEQRVFAGLALLVVVALLWVLVWKPVSDWRTFSVNRHQNAQQMLDWILKNEQAARQSAQRDAGAGERSLIPVITRAAAAHEISLNRLQPESNGIISVALQQQSFNQIIGWIAQLEENNGVSVERANFDDTDAPGYVNAQIRLN